MRAFCLLLALAGTAAAHASTVRAQEPGSGEAAAQEPGSGEAAAQQPEAGPADPAEVAALSDLRALQAELPSVPEAPDEAALQAWADGRRAAYRSFLLAHPRRLASAEAWHALGRLRLQFDPEPEAGLDALASAWEILRDFEGTPPEGMRLSRAGYGESLLAQLLDVDALERAEALLAELRADAAGQPRRLQRLAREASRLAALRRLQPGQVFPGFRAVALDDSGPRGPEDFRGAPLLLEFQAAWTGPARSALPRRVAQAREWQPRGLQLLSVYLDPELEDARALVEEHAPDWPQLWLEGGLQGVTARGLALRSLPRRFLLDADGVILARDLDGAALERAVQSLLGGGD